jgi:hypothetical protein
MASPARIHRRDILASIHESPRLVMKNITVIRAMKLATSLNAIPIMLACSVSKIQKPADCGDRYSVLKMNSYMLKKKNTSETRRKPIFSGQRLELVPTFFAPISRVSGIRYIIICGTFHFAGQENFANTNGLLASLITSKTPYIPKGSVAWLETC